jgi:hypothetical protein
MVGKRGIELAHPLEVSPTTLDETTAPIYVKKPLATKFRMTKIKLSGSVYKPACA